MRDVRDVRDVRAGNAGEELIFADEETVALLHHEAGLAPPPSCCLQEGCAMQVRLWYGSWQLLHEGTADAFGRLLHLFGRQLELVLAEVHVAF